MRNLLKENNSIKAELNDIKKLLINLTSLRSSNLESPALKRLILNILPSEEDNIPTITNTQADANSIDNINTTFTTIECNDQASNQHITNKRDINTVLMSKSPIVIRQSSLVIKTAKTQLNTLIPGLLSHKLQWAVSEVDNISKQDKADISKYTPS
jgi:hypothetical protein